MNPSDSDGATPVRSEDDDRLRAAILQLSTQLQGVEERADLSPVIREAILSGLEHLCVSGDESDLVALQEYLSERDRTLLEEIANCKLEH